MLVRQVLSGVAVSMLMATSAWSQSLTFNEEAVRFGSASIRESSAPKVIALSNAGRRPVFLTDIATTEDFVQTNNCSTWLAKGSGCLVFLRFTPTIAGPRTGALIVRMAPDVEQTLLLGGVGVDSAQAPQAPTAQTFARITNDEERAQALLNDKRYTFEGLLKGNAEDISNAERIFSLTRDSERKRRIASILVSHGSANLIYSSYLVADAENALADALELPWPNLYDGNKHPASPNPLFTEWCQVHRIPFWDMYRVEYYELSNAWYYLAAAGDHRAYDLLLKGLRSTNLMIAASAAQGLAKLGDPRAVDELIAAGHETTGEAIWGIAQSLIYFPDPRAQAAADELTPQQEKRVLEAFRGEASRRGLRALFQW